jgi:hypothetical protein
MFRMPPDHFIDCHKCKHYYVTWQKAHPHGCKAIGFKSLQLPSIAVFKNSGAPCLSFEAKKTKKK